jgi:aspartyl-tRNA(Asn)/glutamyl-tRNA(Gln) amidotransferase subunit A
MADEEFTAYFKKWAEKTGAFIEARPEGFSVGNGGGLESVPFAVKDNLAVAGMSISCGSKLLAGMRSPYTATSVEKLQHAGAVVIGKTNMDEFGMGSSTDASAIQKTNNPWNVDCVAGGSSGGSAAAVAAGLVPFALGSDTGGSVRQPAAFCGVAGLKPTNGAVSRFGLVAYASSLDTVGVLAKNIGLCRSVFTTIRGADPKDQTSSDGPPGMAAPAGPYVIGVLEPETAAQAVAEGFSGDAAPEAAVKAAELDVETRAGFEKAKRGFAEIGCKLIDIAIPALKYAAPAYYTIAAAEASANLARFDGIRYGRRPDWAENPEELVEKARKSGFGDEVKLRILLGTFVLRSGFQDRYYLRAQRIRAGIRQNFEKYLGTAGAPAQGPQACDAILMPVFPTRAFGRGGAGLSPFAQKAADLYTCCANLAGLPAISFPASQEGGFPIGVQLLGRAFNEEQIFALAAAYESVHPFPHPDGFHDFWPGL